MASAASHASFLPPVLTFCGAAVVAVPLFRRLGLSAVLGYLAAGVAIGPSGFALIEDPQTTATVAELGVVLLLFIVGLELKVSHLWSMRKDIFGLGLAQLAVTAVVMAALALLGGLGGIGTGVSGVATAIALQMLEERGDLQAAYGQRSFAILLFQDLSIVPILAVLPLLATGAAPVEGGMIESMVSVGRAAAAIAAVVLIGRYGLNPFFRVLATSGAREVMTASALLVVLGAAALMQAVGLSMAMGAFLAGVLLAESNFRHQLEADIEPFRGILLGLFFMSVGMSIDAALVREHWLWLLVATGVVVAAKIMLVMILVRVFGGSLRDGVRAGAVLSPAGEFAFVLLPLAAGLGLMPGGDAQLVTALAALTMLVGPITAKLLDIVLERRPAASQSDIGIAHRGAGEMSSRVLVIGFGRFGQIVNQVLLAQGVEVTVIDRDVNRIRDAARFGLRVYYGDGTRLDVLRAAGADEAEIVCICVELPETASKIVELVHAEFRQARTFVRAFDRVHAIALMNQEVDYQLRETFESAIAFSRATLEELGTPPQVAAAAAEEVRKRDIARLVLQRSAGDMGGAELVVGAKVEPEPLTAPATKGRALSAETRDLLREEAL
jgi:monovalent cation:proton antiporter-2 (CPA2) family protein